MSPATCVCKEAGPDGIFLYRFGADGSVVGDTWHKTVDEAREQARFEFGDDLSPWKEIPDGTEDFPRFFD